MLAAAAGLALAGLAAAPALADCPDWRFDGVTLTMDAETAWVPQSLPLMAGGNVNLGQCGTVPGIGYVTLAPSFTINYDDRGLGRDLDFRIESNCDTVMLVNDAGAAWHFNDDADNSLNARIRLASAPSGIYDVWVGTFAPQACATTLVIETFPPSPVQAGGTCPDWSLGGAELRLEPGLVETRQVVAGGNLNLFNNTCGIDAYGHVAQAPDFTVYLDAQDVVGTLRVAVRGQCDTLLLINDPTTDWLFNDDHDGLDPMIEISEPEPGRYDVWVGTYGEALCQSSIDFAWLMPEAPQPEAPAGK